MAAPNASFLSFTSLPSSIFGSRTGTGKYLQRDKHSIKTYFLINMRSPSSAGCSEPQHFTFFFFLPFPVKAKKTSTVAVSSCLSIEL